MSRLFDRMRTWWQGTPAGLSVERVDALLTDLQAIEPGVGRLRQIPIDLIAQAVDACLLEMASPATDTSIQRVLRVIASRNHLGPKIDATGAPHTRLA